MAEIVLYQDQDFNPPDDGQTLTDSIEQLGRFNDRLSSLTVTSGTFTLYEDRDFQGASFTICSRGARQ
jgi:Beta/Gamma crystallin